MARNYIRWLIRPVAHCKEGCCKLSWAGRKKAPSKKVTKVAKLMRGL